jgi:hypothetical protein
MWRTFLMENRGVKFCHVLIEVYFDKQHEEIIISIYTCIDYIPSEYVALCEHYHHWPNNPWGNMDNSKGGKETKYQANKIFQGIYSKIITALHKYMEKKNYSTA